MRRRHPHPAAAIALVLLDVALICWFLVLASGCSDELWDITHGTDRLHARRGDFVGGTTRHARSWDEVAQTECDCLGVPNPGIDSLFAGGIWIVDEPYSVFERNRATLYISRHDWDLDAQLGHEIYHALTRRIPQLRHPLDSLNDGGEFDHAMMIRRPDCVHWCPPNQPGCRGVLPKQ